MESAGLVGRDRELAGCAEALRQVQTGERALLMVSGEPGIGKTSLLEELARRVIAAGGQVAWGRTAEVGLTPPFWPWIQVFSTLSVEGDAAPALGNLEDRSNAGARLARFAEVLSFLQRRAAVKPIAILLDDLHAADLSSLQLLEYVLPALVRTRVLVALAARDSEGSPECSAALARIQRGARRLSLGRLSPSEVAALVGPHLDSQRLFELSAGNPLFVEELLASQRSQGALSLPPLSSVRSIIRARVAALPAASATALVAAAVVGREFRGQIVAHMLDRPALGAALSPVLALGMIGVSAPDQYRFSHALLAEAIADELEASERARLHLRAARACERFAPLDLSGIAHHLLAAGPLAAEAAVGASERAAEQCMAQLAFEDAAALLERARHALNMAAPEDGARHAKLLCARSEALQHASRHTEANELCEEAAQLVRALSRNLCASAELPQREKEVDDAALLFARIALARGLEFRFGRTDARLVELLAEALERLGERSRSLRAKLLARLAAAEQPALDPGQPVARALAAIELAAGLSERDRMDVMYVATAALVDYLDPDRLEPIQRDTLSLALRYDRAIALHTRLRLCFTTLLRLDRRAFDAAVSAFRREARALGLPRWLRELHNLDALIALFEGRFQDALAAADKSEAISVALRDEGAAWILGVHRVMAAFVKTEPVPNELRHISDYPPGRAAIRAWFATQDGAREAARSSLAELAGCLPVDSDLAAMVAGAVAFVGDRALAQSTYRALLPRSGQIVLAAMVGHALLDLYDRLLLMLAAVDERWDDIEQHAQRALAVAERVGSPVWSARVRADFAAALDTRARPGDRQRAEKLWREALREAERLAMPGLAARCRTRLGPTPSAAHEHVPKPATASAGVSLQREGELWIVRGFGEQLHVKDSRGMLWLARLLEEPGRELHVLDLASAPGGALAGDAGPALDDKARAAYGARIRALRAEREQAEADNDLARMERAAEEIEALTTEIERAFGLGGRERRVGAASERARSNVQRRISHALAQIQAGSPRLGEHFAASVKTGTFCSYTPATIAPAARRR